MGLKNDGTVSPSQFITTYQAQLREQFLSSILKTLGDTRVLFLPKGTDTTTSLDESLTGRTLTHDATIAGRLAPFGLGYYTTFNGSNQFATAPDTANLTIAAAAFSVGAWVNITNTGAERCILSKYNVAATTREWKLSIGVDDLIYLVLYDETSDDFPFRASNAAPSAAAWHLIVATYDGAANAAGIIIYVDGLAVASTATEDAGYTQIRDTAAVLTLGGTDAGAATPFNGSIAGAFFCAGALSASDVWALKKDGNAYFNLSL